MKTFAIGAWQVALLYGLYFLIDTVINIFKLPIPSSLAGIIIVFLLLQTKAIRYEWFETGSNWLLAELLLFFIPSAVGIIDYQYFFETCGVKLLCAIFFRRRRRDLSC